MAKTLVADVIIPTEFEKYAIERTAELSRFGESGIIEMDLSVDVEITVVLRHWQADQQYLEMLNKR